MLNQSQTQGARIVGKGAATAEGPGPDVMAAATLDGNRVISSDAEDLGIAAQLLVEEHSGLQSVSVNKPRQPDEDIASLVAVKGVRRTRDAFCPLRSHRLYRNG